MTQQVSVCLRFELLTSCSLCAFKGLRCQERKKGKKEKQLKKSLSVVIYKTGSDLRERLSVVTKQVNNKALNHSDGGRPSFSVKCSFHCTSRHEDDKNCELRMHKWFQVEEYGMAAHLHFKQKRYIQPLVSCFFKGMHT